MSWLQLSSDIEVLTFTLQPITLTQSKCQCNRLHHG
jgi:hypothetical protein